MKDAILHAALFTPMAEGAWGLPLILWGAPGTTKTATIKALGKAYGFHVEHLAPGERGEGAFGVTPVPVQGAEGRTVLAYPAPEWVLKLRTGDGKEEAGIVFFDELNTAPPALQPALLGGIQERRVGGHTFGPRVRVLGAANPVNQSAGGWDIAPPVANRLGHIDWPAPEARAWADWLVGSNIEIPEGDANGEERRVLKAWPEAFAKAAGTISAFVNRRPELLHKMPNDGDPAQGRAWPSPRTWEYATRALASTAVHGLNAADSDELIAAFVGNGAAGELATWLAEVDLPSPAEVLDGKVAFKHNPVRLDRTEAVLSACAALVAPEKAEKRDARAEVLIALIDKVSDDAKDIVIPAMRTLVKTNKLTRTEKARPVVAKLHGVVMASGITANSGR